MTTRSSLAILALGFCGGAQALVAYSNFAPSHGYNASVAYTLGDNIRQDIAIPFVAAEGGRFDSFTVAVRHFAGEQEIRFELCTDDNGQIGDWFFAAGWIVPSNTDSLRTIMNPFPWITLNQGERYWLRGTAPIADSHLGWCFNGTGATGDYAYRWGDGIWNPVNGELPALEVTVEAVPEPATLFALTAGLALLARRRR